MSTPDIDIESRPNSNQISSRKSVLPNMSGFHAVKSRIKGDLRSTTMVKDFNKGYELMQKLNDNGLEVVLPVSDSWVYFCIGGERTNRLIKFMDTRTGKLYLEVSHL